ncbi:MAG: 4Fe-4S binding protein [Dehalococcoidia bacterium]|nr:4Fe-4S binding protein [Dehalococcoidia bacterium]
MLRVAERPCPTATAESRIDLLRWGPLRRALTHRLFPFVLVLPALFAFVLVILTGLLGTPVGSANFSIVFTWIVWWGALILLLIPLGARAWCSVCPLAATGEWVQRRAILVAGRRPLTLRLDWPRSLRGLWVQNGAIAGMAVFSVVILTRPAATATALLALSLLALGLFLVFKRRAFCRYVCPMGGFIGAYAGAAPLEVRAVDPDVCLAHCGPNAKECLKGSSAGFGCPWLEYPGTMERNLYCGMCGECVKTCPKENVALNLRPFGADLLAPRYRTDEAHKAVMLLSAALLYSAVMAGPWGWLRDWANLGSGEPATFLAYAGLLLVAMLALAPGAFFAAAWLGKAVSRAREASDRRLFVAFAYAAAPLGLAAWVAFSLDFLFANASNVPPVLSDPFGWGWDLFGTAGYAWEPYAPRVLPYLQAPVLGVGLAASISAARRAAGACLGDETAARRSVVPVAALLTLIALIFLWLFMG